jgi:hypothetical protein
MDQLTIYAVIGPIGHNLNLKRCSFCFNAQRRLVGVGINFAASGFLTRNTGAEQFMVLNILLCASGVTFVNRFDSRGAAAMGAETRGSSGTTAGVSLRGLTRAHPPRTETRSWERRHPALVAAPAARKWAAHRDPTIGRGVEA